MKSLISILLLLFASFTYAAGQPASEASIKQLIEVTRASKLMDNMITQMDNVMQKTMKQMIGDKTLDPRQQAILDDMQKKVVELFAQEMKWETLEPEFVAIYQKAFTEDEITGMLDFYKTDAGQAVIDKMPVVMRYSMEMMQNRMVQIMPKLQQIQNEHVEQLKNCCQEDAKQE